MGLMSMLAGVFSCTAQTEGFKSVDVEDFAQFIADSTVTRLDVRTAEEFAAGHIDKAINIDVLKTDFESKSAALPKDRAVALYCRSGNRSKRAAAILHRQGYKVVELGSGFNGWKSAGKPTTTTATSPASQLGGE